MAALAILKCDVCAKKFTGAVCYQQHLESEKHKRKVQFQQLQNNDVSNVVTTLKLNSREEITCTICHLAFENIQQYQKHAESLEHAKQMIKNITDKETSNEIILDSSVNNSISSNAADDCLQDNVVAENAKISFSGVNIAKPFFSRCDICCKMFSGPESYEQHMVSNGHKKMIAQNASGILHPNSNSNFSALLSCDVCKKRFSGPVSYEQHLNSEVHKKKVLNDQLMQKYDINGSPCSSSSVEVPNSTSAANRQKDESILNCCKMFSGPESYEQHMVSNGHKKMIAQNASGILHPNSNSDFSALLSCDVCKKRFSGPVSYEQHLNSEVHKKKVLNDQLMQKYVINGSPCSSSSVEVPDSTSAANRQKDESILNRLYTINTDAHFWYCHLCKIQKPDDMSYELHLESKDHCKNVQITVLETKHDDQSVKMDQGNQEHEHPKENKVYESSNSIKNNSNSILQDLNVLDLVAQDELNITFFSPESELSFEKSEVKDAIVQIPIENEEAINGVYKMCTICNVILSDVDELTSHYESRDHCMKKWSIEK